MRELLREKLTVLGYDNNLFGLHSFRAGGATAAANAGVSDRLFKPPLPKDKVFKLKQFLIEVLKFDKRPIEFEEHWKLRMY